MKKHLLKFLLALFLFTGWQSSFGQVMITAIADGDCSGGTPKILEIYAKGTIDFTLYTLQNQTNANTSWGNNQDLSSFGTVTDAFVYVYYDGSYDNISTEFPSASTLIESGTMNLNGDDRVRIIETGSGTVIDQYGVSDSDGTGKSWEWKDSYAKRNDNTGPDAGFTESNWTMAGVLALDGGGTCQGGSTFETMMGGIGTFSFGDSQAPQSTWNPLTGATAVEIDAAITVTFDEAIRDIGTDADFDNTTIDALITTFETVIGATPVTFDATIDGTNQIITITPNADLAFDTEYTITLAAVEDASDNATIGETITFTTKPDADKDSKVIAPVAQVDATTVESIITDSVAVFKFTISDLGTADGLDTKVSQITLKGGPNNTIAFDENLAYGYLISESGTNIPFGGGPTGPNDLPLTFGPDVLTIADGADSTYTVYFLLDNEKIADGSVIQVMIDADNNGFIANATGSEFATDFTTDIVGNDITLNVTATELHFYTQPTIAYVGDNLAEVKVEATDVHGNVDIDYTTDITITATGATLTGSPVASTPVDGLATFETLSFSNAGTGITLTAASGAFTDATSDAFDIIEVPADDLYFSEYIEGGGSNKAFEIYNPTSSAIDLSNYVVKQSYNGDGWGIRGTADSRYVLPLTGTIEAGDVYVVINDGADIQEIIDAADLALTYDGTANNSDGSNVAAFGGNDALGLFKNDVRIDVIGFELVADGAGPWEVAGDTDATINNTILRKVGITHGNTDWAWSAGTNEEDSEWKVYNINATGNIGIPTPEASNEAEIKTFELPGLELTNAIIDNNNSTVTLEILKDSSLVDREPVITVSEGATIVPLSGAVQDFTAMVPYTVTAEDGVTERIWTVTVTASPTLSTFAEILEIEIEDATNIVINSTEGTITADVPYGYAITSVKPVFEISAGATIDDAVDPRDFTTPQTYVVNAQDASSKNWEITLNVFEPTEVTIYDIQYTTDASGDSPYEGQVVKTSGIVTAIDEGSSLWIQDGTGVWNGVYVFSSATSNTVTVGDNIEFAAEVDEFYTLTELKNVLGLNIISSGNTLPAISEITTLQAQDEAYEGVLIKVSSATCTSADEGNGMFEVNDGSGALLADDDIFKFTATASKTYDITGIGSYSFSARKILPRDADDIEEVVIEGINDLGLNSVKLYPNPSNGLVTLELNNVNNEELYVEVYDVIGKLVYKTNITENRTDIDLTNMNAGIYYVSVNSNNNKKVSKIMIQ